MGWLIPSVGAHTLLWCAVALAQQPGPPAAVEPVKPSPAPMPVPVVESLSAQVKELQPSLYYLKDKEGNLQPVPNFKFEDFEEMVKRKHRLDQADQTPRYSLQSLSIQGTAQGNRAELTVKVSILVRDENWVRIPLRLEEAVLREAAQYQGSGQQFLHFEEGDDGYVCWIRGGQTQPHTLTLNVLVPITSVGDETRLKLSSPRATTSELRLKVPIDGALGEVSEGATLLAPSKAGEGTTELTAMGLGGDFELTWRKPGHRSAETETVLESVGSILVKIDGRNVNADARLTVRGYGDSFDRFQVRLPKGASLIAGKTVGYTVVPAPAKSATADDRALVNVRLPKKTNGPVDIRLATRQPADTAGSTGWIDVAGFEVVEAVRQWGHLAIGASGDWQILWGPHRGVRQVDQLPDTLRHENLAAGFEYFSQPCSLGVRVVPRQTRVSVDPEYLLLIDPDRVQLEARLKYTVRGAKVSALDVELPDWQLDEIGPDNLVAREGVVAGQNGVFSIPLVQPSMGQIEITFRARRTVSRDAKTLTLPLPKPQAAICGPAAVVVLPADNVELTPKVDAMVGLVRQQVAPLMKLPKRQQAPLYYRGEMPKAAFAAEMRVHTQTIAVDVTSQVSLEQGKTHVEQRLAYTIAYEPLDKLMLDVPRSLAASEALEILLEGQRLPLLEPLDQATKEEPADPVRKRVALPTARIGALELLVRYPLELERIPPGASVIAKVPLVMPTEGKLGSNRLEVVARPGVRVEHRQDVWTVVEKEVGASPSRPHGLLVASTGRTREAELAIHLQEQDASAATIVGQAWVQTWLTASAHQERAVFRFTSNQKELELLLPPGADVSALELWLDRELLRLPATAEGRVVIPLSSDDGLRPHMIDARYHFPAPRSDMGRLSIQFPRLGRDAWVRRMYWQLVVPANEHLVAEPAEFTPESVWGWYGLYWGRRPLLSQSQLEDWCGAPHARALPPDVNCYLFSSLGIIERSEVLTAGRTMIVLWASGLTLLAGLVLIYVRAARHPLTLLILAVLLGCAVVIYPDSAMLFAQAASLGIVMAILGGRLRARRARRAKSLMQEVASSVVHRNSTRTQPQERGVDADLPTVTSPAVIMSRSSDALP